MVGLAGGATQDVDAGEPIQLEAFSTSLSSVLCSFHCGSTAPPDFEKVAWDILAACIAGRDDGSHFLSCDELLLLCDVLQRNYVVFGTYGTSASFRGCPLGHAGVVPVLVASHEGLHSAATGSSC